MIKPLLIFIFLTYHTHSLEIRTPNELTWSTESFPGLETHTFYYQKSNDIEYIINLEAVLLNGSGWEISDVYERYVNLNKVLSKGCGIEARSLTVRVLTPSTEELLRPGNLTKEVLNFLEHFPRTDNIRMFYIESTPISKGRAYAEVWHGPTSPITGTIFIARKVLIIPLVEDTLGVYEFSEDISVNVDVHELVHVLSNLIHTDSVPNLMNSASSDFSESSKILTKYCERAVTHKEVIKVFNRPAWLNNFTNFFD